jgi:splicing factor 1
MASTGFGAPGEDVYRYEEQQERRALLKSLHLPMKQWFLQLPAAFLSSTGFSSFPAFWQDLEHWPHVKQVQKLYLAATETGDADGVDIFRLYDKLFSRPKEEEEVVAPSEDSASGNGPQGSDSLSSGVEPAVEGGRKRRNRWGGADEVAPDASASSTATTATTATEQTTATTTTTATTSSESAPKKRRSRFSAASSTTEVTVPPPASSEPAGPAAGLAAAAALAAKLGIGSALPPAGATSFVPVTPLVRPVITEEVMQQTMILQMQLQNLGERLMTVTADAAALENDPNRPPSPPPKYDSRGVRTNTREVRMREALTQERVATIEQLLQVNPLYQPPPDFVRAKPFKKVYIPYKDHPTYNFIGIIIGPRGNTQKRMEQETGTKISIRGKGSVKDGSKGRAKHDGPDEDDELHVHVDGPTMEMVENAVKLIEELLVVVDDDKNEHKQKQLRELALINGTLKEDEYCSVCAERGHRHFECPQRTKSFKAAGVKCAICGDQSHPTRDCPMKNDAPTNEVALDTEYESFMNELGDGGKKTVSAGVGRSANSGSAGSEQRAGSREVSEDEKVKISMSSSGAGVQQTVIHVKTVLTGMSLPTPSSQPQQQVPYQQPQQVPTPMTGHPPQMSYDPAQQQWVQQQYGGYPQQHYGSYQQPVQYDAYGYPMYPAYSQPIPPNPGYDSAPAAPSTSSFPPPPPPPDQDMDMGC